MTVHTKIDGAVIANGRGYARPARPTVVICMDGSEPAYIEAASAKGLTPNLDRIMKAGASTYAYSVIPSFTNPNNLSIITGRPPAVHGIAGNFFYDREAREEVMMNDARFLRAPTILAEFQKAGLKVAMVTAKDKLRTLLGKGLDFGSGTAIAFSSEKADKANKAENGIEKVLDFVGMPVPSVYSADLSEFVFAAGVKLLESFKPDLMYLSTTDYVQHKAAPGSEMADSFYAMFDGYVGKLDALGCTLVITADHGMNDKHLANGEPDVVYLQSLMDEWYGKGTMRVILPITDPYVVHHGALGSFATVYLPEGASQEEVAARISGLDGIALAVTAAEACERFELPADRIGDVVAISTRQKVIGTSPNRHDLSGLTEPLRSHGGITEQRVPMIANRPIAVPDGRILRNFDVFDVALNLVH
ncbi:phosphonoacetate hydrolase [Bosea sp. (in: a-proteobacteria)]|jgi:phosphonoacetate hydrolase|uniref:phosphonoacetate hydrolase n=1 Tax=Bosea sp. (in: a-proteobacteria) TaxID=1871050 RepID=UPI002DDD35CB|nr:phosphonoacetate hydrolase [Bosea sp. (in: a-proteobacteria)]HEV2511502.1 phosphonoacetate hydrolase [Bosea sp. (in: a-proteobacteria)]